MELKDKLGATLGEFDKLSDRDSVYKTLVKIFVVYKMMRNEPQFWTDRNFSSKDINKARIYMSMGAAQKKAAALTSHDFYEWKVDDVANLIRKRIVKKASKRKIAMNIDNHERELWIQNDEGLYRWWKGEKMSLRKFIKENKDEIDAAIKRAMSGKASLSRNGSRLLRIATNVIRKSYIEIKKAEDPKGVLKKVNKIAGTKLTPTNLPHNWGFKSTGDDAFYYVVVDENGNSGSGGRDQSVIRIFARRSNEKGSLPVLYMATIGSEITGGSPKTIKASYHVISGITCECLSCGWKGDVGDEHCRDVPCPECGEMTMRRQDRPGIGRLSSKQAIEVGDKVEFSRDWIRSIGAVYGELPRAKGIVKKIKNAGSRSAIAVVDWDGDPDEVPQKSLVTNLRKVK